MALDYSQIAKHAISVANTEESLYIVPALTKIVGQVIVANNSTSSNHKFRFAVVAAGGAATSSDFIAYDVTLTPGETWVVTGLTLKAGYELRVQSDATSTTAGTGIIFQLYGEVQT